MRRKARVLCALGAAAALGLVVAGADPAGAQDVGLNPDGSARMHLGSVGPWQQTPVARIHFNPLMASRAWELRMQPLSAALQGPSGSIPLERLQWSVGMGPSYSEGPRHPLSSGTTVLHRLDEPPYPLAVYWWFRPTWEDRASEHPYSLTIAYTATAGTGDTVSSALIYPNPYDPTTGQHLHVLARWGGLPDDPQWTYGRPLDLRVSTVGPDRPPCGHPLAADVLDSPRGSLDVHTPDAPPWVQYPWLEVTWDGRDQGGQLVAPGRYCVSLVTAAGWNMEPVTLASGIVTVGSAQGAAGGSVVVELHNRRTGQPVAGATVRVHREPGGMGREVTAGADGQARLDGLVAGAYVVTATAPGYREARAEVAVEAARTRVPVRVALAMEPVLAPRLGVRLLPQATGRVDVGELVGVEVRVEPPPSGDGASMERGEVVVELSSGLAALAGTVEVSSGAGQAAVADSGRVRWEVAMPGPSGSSPFLRFVAAVTPHAWGLREVRVKATGTFWAQLQGEPVRLEAEPVGAAAELEHSQGIRRATVLGRVVDGSGRGVQGARVFSEDGSLATSGPAGWFSLAVTPGPHLLTAQAAGAPPSRAVLVPGRAMAMVVARGEGVNPVILTLGEQTSDPAPAAGVAAAAEVQWAAAGEASASGGLVASASGGWGQAHLAVRAEGSGIVVTSASLVVGGHVLALGLAERDSAVFIQRLYPPEETGLGDWPATVRGPVALWHWASGDGRLTAGVVAGQPAGLPNGASGTDAVPAARAVAAARLELGVQQAWGRLAWHEQPGPMVSVSDESSAAHRVGWEVGVRHSGGWYSLGVAMAAELPVDGHGNPGPVDGQGLKLRVTGEGESAPYALDYRRVTGALAQSSFAFASPGPAGQTDPLEVALTAAGYSRQAAEGLEELRVEAGSMGWGLRRLEVPELSMVDSYAAFIWAPGGGADARGRGRGDPGGDTSSQPSAYGDPSVDELLAGAQAKTAAGSSRGPEWGLRVGIVSAQSPGEVSAIEPWWRPYLSAQGSWPLWPTASRQAAVGAALTLLTGPPGSTPDDTPVGRVSTWAELGGELAEGIRAGIKASWAGRWERPGLVAAPGLSLQAELRPRRPLRLAVGASATPSGLLWDQAVLGFESPWLRLEVQATPADFKVSAAWTPVGPWRLQALGRWEALTENARLQGFEASGAYLGSSWAGRADLRMGPAGWAVTWAAQRVDSLPPTDDLQKPAGLAAWRPSIEATYKHWRAGAAELHTVMVRPALRIPVGARWGLFAEGATAAQFTADGSWRPQPVSAGAVGLYAQPDLGIAALRVEVGHRWSSEGSGLPWGPPGLFARVGGWSLSPAR